MDALQLTLKPSELESFLEQAIPAREPTLIVGPPGVGKTDVVKKATAKVGADLILDHPVVKDPTDFKGLPWKDEQGTGATFLPFGNLARARAATTLTTWFFDDLGQALAATQASAMQLLLGGTLNGHKLPDCVGFLAATNRRTDRAAVSGILEPVKSRFITIIHLMPDLDDWCNWAFSHGMPPELIAFLRFRPDLLCDFQPTADMTNSPLPRTWANAGRLLKLDLSDHVMLVALAGAVGQGAAMELEGFRKLWKALPSIDAILLDPMSGVIPDKVSTLYAVVTALGMKANQQTFGRIAKYAERLNDENHGDFASLLVRDCIRQDDALKQTTDFIRLMSGPLGKLIGGVA